MVPKQFDAKIGHAANAVAVRAFIDWVLFPCQSEAALPCPTGKPQRGSFDAYF